MLSPNGIRRSSFDSGNSIAAESDALNVAHHEIGVRHSEASLRRWLKLITVVNSGPRAGVEPASRCGK